MTWLTDFQEEIRKSLVDFDESIVAKKAKYFYVDGGSCDIRIAIEFDVQEFGTGDTGTSERRNEAEIVNGQLRRSPKRGDKIVCESNTLTIQDLLSDDGILTVVSVK